MPNGQDRTETGSLTGLTEQEARSFNKIFVVSFVIYLIVAIGAHVLAWMWKPWGV